MQFIVTLMLGAALVAGGCGDSDSNGGNGGSAGMAGGGGGPGGSAGGGGMGGDEAPVITMIAWAPDGACALGTPGDYTVTITATDADSDPSSLEYDGSVLGCTGQIDAATSTVSCPNAAPYGGTAVVEDGDGNVSVPVEFTIEVCATDSVSP